MPAMAEADFPPLLSGLSQLPVPMPLWPNDASNNPDQDDEDDQPQRSKRSRVALACQRCKARKQKCDGAQPCSKCRAHNHGCEYVVPQKPVPFGKNQYIKALERRVAELETILARQQGVADDHWGNDATAAGRTTSGVIAAPESNAESSLQAATTTTAEGASEEGGGQWMQDDGNHEHESPGSEPADSAEAILEWQDGVDSVVSVLRCLSLDVNGSGYMGASSHVALGRLFSFLGRGASGVSTDDQRRRQSTSGGAPVVMPSAAADWDEDVGLDDVPDAVAERLFQGYLKHIATRWPLVHSVWIRQVHNRRRSVTNVFEKAILHLVYATAGRFIETTGESGPFHFKAHYASAFRLLDDILGFNDVRTVQVLMLMAVYCLRDPVGAGAWTCSRTALLIAIDHGLHRQTKALSRLTMENQLRKRLFWSCYAFDRQISIPMGRPFGISDRDIDIELPLDINEDTTADRLADAPLGSRTKSTSLTSFVLIARLRQIESDIQQTIYRVDDSITIDDSVIDGFLSRLERWKAMIPQDSYNFTDNGAVPFDGYYFYMVFYYKCQRLLLYPQISKSRVAPRFLKECAKACAGVCGAYKRLHQTLAVGYSFMALQTVFMAGLTLVYCLWISPDEIFDVTTSNGVHDCSIVLFVIAERVPSAKKYRNAFEAIRQKVIDQISRSEATGRKSRETVPGLTADLVGGESADFFQQSSMPFLAENGSFEEFSQIIMDMAGEDFPSGDITGNGSGHDGDGGMGGGGYYDLVPDAPVAADSAYFRPPQTAGELGHSMGLQGGYGGVSPPQYGYSQV